MTQNTAYYSNIAAKSAIGFDSSNVTGGYAAHQRFFCVHSMASSFMDGPCGRLSSLPVPVTGLSTCMVPFTLLTEGKRKTKPFNRATKMTNSISIGHTTELPLVFYKNQPVVTLAMIDRVHGRTDGTARRTFTANKERLIPDEDYFKLSESEMKAMDEFRPSANPKGILLISESGYLMLVKSFNDDLAWKIQRQLIKAYFRAKPPAIQTITKQQFLDLRRIVFSISDKLPGRQSVEWHIWKRVRDMFGVKSAMDLPASEFQAAENMLLQLQATTEEFDNQVSAIKKRFCKEVLLVDGDMGELVQLLEQID